MKRYELDENYFKEINTEQKAYILGFIFADGNISDGKDKHYRLRIHLKRDDVDILEKIRNELSYTGEIKLRTLKSKKSYGYEICCLEISNKTLVTDLKHLGCIPCKSNVCKFPSSISENLKRHFVRGYFDANGAVYWANGFKRMSDLKLSISSGSKDMLESIISIIIENNDGVNPLGFRSKSSSCEYAKSGIQALKILNWMYTDSNIHLNRKYNHYKVVS